MSRRRVITGFTFYIYHSGCNVGKGVEARLEIGKTLKAMITYGVMSMEPITGTKFSPVNFLGIKSFKCVHIKQYVTSSYLEFLCNYKANRFTS